MPTNREWLEHTERAAWDTVQSLRKQIEEERARFLRLTPVRESWQRILEVLDVARAEHGIAAEQYADIVEALAAQLRNHKEEREQLVYRLEVERKAARSAAERAEIARAPIIEKAPSKGSRVRRFAEQIAALRRQHAESGRPRTPPRLDRLVAAIEAKVDELEGAGAADMARVAVELGALSLRVAELADRRGARRGPPGKEEE